MGNRKIYIICTYNSRGRYIKTATTNAARADALARRVVEAYTASGYTLTETQDLPNGDGWEQDGPGVSSVVRVYHLHTAADDWQNVELYRVEELTQKTANNG